MIQNLNAIKDFLEIDDHLGTSGMPVRSQFEAVRSAGYETVINLALPGSPNAIPDEEEIVQALGMDYVHIPVVWEDPRPENFERFCEAMKLHSGRKIFAHCVLNMRVSAFVFLYRVIECGVSVEAARETLREIWEPEGVWEAFVRGILEGKGIAYE